MAQRIWELHGRNLGGAIRSTPEGDADVGGLVFSEKAYLLAMRDFRPGEIVEMVRCEGPAGAAAHLISHFNRPESLNLSGGRGLISHRGGAAPTPIVKRSDEVPALVVPRLPYY